ncbi:bifunctional diguanylate cyclase/phosphodiesterase [Delftia sp. UME58]|uniref:putative bifunctional diguanylate cyclase/phosphodiesterase n=1 Tax=Delftia sp. UME58 TaxID=1862322 RepID=UPI001602B27E|nr:GGDEF and EAL domain-containing protein [Delftia sp. UME58]MBB1651892.1 diguanylate cyclase [Delftia sp. UME58]
MSYGLLAFGWIVLSDKLLFALAGSADIGWLSVVKGLFFVLATDFLLFFALCSVPAGQNIGASAIAQEMGPRRFPVWASYLFALAMSLAVLAASSTLASQFGERSLLLLFMLPVLVSALIGGLGPGLLATAFAAYSLDQTDGVAVRDWAQWGVVAVNGLAVSVLAETLQRSLRKANMQRQLLDSVISGTSDAVFVKDLRGRYLLVNRAAASVVGRQAEDIVGKDDFALFPFGVASDIRRKDRDVLCQEVATHEEQLTVEPGRTLDFLVTKGPVRNTAGHIAGLFGISRDITERKRFERELAQAAVVFDSSHQGIMVVDPARRITRVNPAFTRITGYAPEDVIGKTPRMLSSGLHGPEFYRQIWACIARDGFWHGEIWNRRKTGEIFAEMLSISAAQGAGGEIEHYIGVFTDISHIKAHEAELERVTHYDLLTGLPNRRLLIDRLNQAMLRTAREGRSLAVCFLDLDGFKEINDLYGAAAGDALLVGVAAHLKSVLRSEDTLARLGGDEFVLLLSHIGSAEHCTTILDRVLEAASRPVPVQDRVLSVTASLGVSLYPDDQADPDLLLRHADQAMCVAKQAGRNRYQLFDPENDRKAHARRLQLGWLRQALEQGEFLLHYQPKVELGGGKLVGAEALLRWHDPRQGLRAPGEFLPFVAGSDLERPLGDWVIGEAVAQAARWFGEGLDLCVSINVSANQLLDGGFHATMAQVLARHPELPPHLIELEILESAAIADMQQAIQVMGQCRQLGIRFALDDFGTGYSSLTYLRKLPVQSLKIDQSFVRDMLADPDDLGIVEGVIQLASTFQLESVAEGVETPRHARRLRDMGCHVAQGYGIARPMPADQLPAWAARWGAGDNWLAHGRHMPSEA